LSSKGGELPGRLLGDYGWATGHANSSVDFVFHLTPWDACLHLHFLERVEPFTLVCTRDQLALVGRITPERSFDQLRGFAGEMAERLVHAHAFFCCDKAKLVEAIPVSWIEHEGVSDRTIVGYLHRSASRTVPDEKHPDNVPFRKSLDLLSLVFIGGSGLARIGPNEEPEGQALVYALADYSRARREPGPYYAFHAYRALEDLNYAFRGNDRGARWRELNKALGTSEETWKDLTHAGEAARHLNPEEIRRLEGEATRKHLLASIDTSKPASGRQVKTGQRGRGVETGSSLSRRVLRGQAAAAGGRAGGRESRMQLSVG
jgi:hypothetical protein